jgi:hypothetical protein
MQRRKLLAGTGIILALSALAFGWMRSGPLLDVHSSHGVDLYLHDVYFVVSPLHILILSLLLSGSAVLLYFAGYHFTPHGFTRSLTFASLALMTSSCVVVCIAAGLLLRDLPPHPWLLYSLFAAAILFVLGFALFSTCLLWALLSNLVRVARRRLS